MSGRNNREQYLIRLKSFLKLLGSPEKKIPHFIHVTGTSGKGSVCIMLASILGAANPNKKIGLLTSPHPSTITERWEINNKAMTPKKFISIVEKIKTAMQIHLRKSGNEPISYAEMMTAVGLYYFAKKRVDWAVLEVGCGGRYDSTNVIPKKDMAVITNIGLDHKKILGNTKAKITYEKSGIIKHGAAVFTGEKKPRLIEIMKAECVKQKTELKTVDTDDYKIISIGLNTIDYIFKNKTYHLNTIGAHQIKNAVLATKVAEYLNIPYSKIAIGLKNATLPMRLEIVARNPLTIIDGAHNHDKMKTTVVAIKTLIKNKKIQGKIHLIAGFCADKDIINLVKQLASLAPATIACTRFTSNIFRKTANPQKLAEAFDKLAPKSKIKLFLDSNEALGWAQKQAKNNDLILSTGSIFLSGELRPIFDTQPNLG